MHTRWLATVTVVLVAGAARAQPAPLRLVVLPTQTAGYIPQRGYWRGQFDERIAAAGRQRAAVVTAALPVDESACADAACFAELVRKYGDRLGFNGVVAATAKIDRQVPPSYHLDVTAFVAGQLVHDSQLCRVCGEVQAADALSAMAGRLIAASATAAERRPPEPRRVPEPAEPSPPPTADEAPRPNDSAPAANTAALTPPPPTDTRPRRLGRRALIGLTVATAAVGAGGLALVALGGVVLADDGRPTCGGSATTCPTVFRTGAQGGALVAAGAAATIGAAIGLGFELRAFGRAPARLALAPWLGSDGAGLVAGGRW